MPMYDFLCQSCQKNFEELTSSQETPPCPHCKSENVVREISAPSPLKTGAFPYKAGPVHPMMQRSGAGCGAVCGSGGFA